MITETRDRQLQQQICSNPLTRHHNRASWLSYRGLCMQHSVHQGEHIVEILGRPCLRRAPQSWSPPTGILQVYEIRNLIQTEENQRREQTLLCKNQLNLGKCTENLAHVSIIS